jgi:hypothetical protein
MSDAYTKDEVDAKQQAFGDVMICEGAMEPPGETEEEQRAALVAAWQRLIDSGTCWSLQGWFGRMATALIAQGTCTAPAKTEET